jgi:hypothetical protein
MSVQILCFVFLTRTKQREREEGENPVRANLIERRPGEVKKLISLLVIAAVVATFVVPATVGAWDPGTTPPDKNLYASTPVGVMLAQALSIGLSLLPKWVATSTGNVTTEQIDQYGQWSSANTSAYNISGLTKEGRTFVGGLADIITWGVKILADLVRIMGGANPA